MKLLNRFHCHRNLPNEISLVVRIHNSKLEPYMLDLIAKALNKSCNSLETIKIENCGIGDDGLKSFLTCLSAESFPKLHHIDFSNNFLCKYILLRDDFLYLPFSSAVVFYCYS